MKYLGANWKTTLAGIATILGAIADIIHSISASEPIKWDVDITAVITGVGLLVAKDGSTHSTSAQVETADFKKQVEIEKQN